MTGAIDDAHVTTVGTAPTTQAAQRIDSLDFFRGICALMVAAYHYRLWSEMSVVQPIDGLLAFCGTYGVSMFFILSGFSLAHAYFKDFSKAVTGPKIVRYFRRRIGRLVPLFAAITVLSVLGRHLTGGDDVDGWVAVANAVLLFGFFDPAKTPVIGGWSIGIEVVFYLILPIMLLLHKHVRIFLAVSVFLTAWISYDLAQHSSLANGWSVYVAPANHFVFFAMGVAGGLINDRLRPTSGRWVSIWCAAMVGLVSIMATGATELEVVTEWRRVALASISFATVMVISTWHVDPAASKFCRSLGGLSYPMYLLHPLVFFAAAAVVQINTIQIWGLLVLCTLLAIAVDRLFEQPLQRIVRRSGW